MRPAVWLAMAREDLQAAELLARHGIPQLALFHAEQARAKASHALRSHQQASGGLCPSSKAADGGQTGPDGGWCALPCSVSPPSHAEPDDGNMAREAVAAARRVLNQITDQIYGTSLRSVE
jgi:hypothetical protein